MPTIKFVIFCDDEIVYTEISQILSGNLKDLKVSYTLAHFESGIDRLKSDGNIIIFSLTEHSPINELSELRGSSPESLIIAVYSGGPLNYCLSEIEEYIDDLLEISPRHEDVLGIRVRKIVEQYRNKIDSLESRAYLTSETINQGDRTAITIKSERLSKALSIGGMGYWWFNVELMEVYWSDELYELFGLSPEEDKMSFETFVELLHPEDTEYFTASTLAELPANIHESLDYRVILKDGRTRWMRTTPSLVSERDGQVTVIEGVTQDVTSFKEYDVQLQESEEMYRVLFDKTPLIKLIFDAGNYHIKRVNKQTEAFFGYPAEELIGTRVYGLFNQSEGWEKGINEIIELANDGSFESTCIKADGGLATVIINASHFELNGEPVVQFTIRDVTQERAYMDEILQLSLIVSKTDNAIIITDANERIEFVNKGVERIFGYSEAEMLGQNPSMLQGKDTSDSDRIHIRKSLDAQKPFKASILNYTKGGRPIWIELSITPIFDNSGRLIKFIAIESDITERKVEAMESELFGAISHTLNTPGNLSELLGRVLEKIGESTNHAFAEAWLMNMDGSQLNQFAVNGNGSFKNINSHKGPDYQEKGEGLAGMIWEQASTRYWSSLDTATLNLPVSVVNGEKITSGLGVPIWYKNELIGVFMFYYTNKHPIKPYHQKVLSGLSYKLGPELKQKKAEDELNAFFHLSPDLMCIAGADGFLKKVNKSFIRIIGYALEDFINEPLVNFIHPDDRVKILESILDISKNQVIQTINRVISKEGGVKWISWTGFADISQQLFYIVGREITRERALEIEKLNHLKTLEKQNEKLREIAWTQSHIVRAPLVRLISVIELMQKYKLKEEDKGFLLESMNTSAKELDTIIKDMIRGSSGVINK